MSKGSGGGGRGGRSGSGRVSVAQSRSSMFNITPGARIHSVMPTRAGTYVVRMSALRGTKFTNKVAGREGSIREGIARGYKFSGVSMVRGKSGRLELTDGNHRFRVARKRGESLVLVKFGGRSL